MTPDDVLDEFLRSAELHQSTARADRAQESSAFLLSLTKPGQSAYSAVAPVTGEVGKSALINNVQTAPKQMGDKGPGEREAIRVFHSQIPNQPTTSVFNSEPFKGVQDKPHPGGVPLVDHLAAWVHNNPEWDGILPQVQQLRSSRIPPQASSNVRELVIGVSSSKDWLDATQFVLQQSLSNSSKLYPFCAADTEGLQVRPSWVSFPKESAWDSLLTWINMDAVIGNEELEFTVAANREPGCNIPVRFMYGSVDWEIHVLLPIRHFTANGIQKVALSLNTTFCEEAKAFFKPLGPALGVGITSDLVEWSQLLRAIWDTNVIETMAKPVELEHLARVARINTPNSSIFHLNWWSFGTVLPKTMASIGDKKWARPLHQIPASLRRYLTADIAQTVKMGSLFTMIWAVQMFPDMSIVSDASSFNPVTFVQWIQKYFFQALFPGWRKIVTDQDGHWKSVSKQLVWEAQDNLPSLLRRLDPPSLNEHQLLWIQPGWPAITSGGARFMNWARSEFIERLPALRKLDPTSWIIHHEDKKLFWRFSHPKEASARASFAPVSVSNLVANPGLESKLPLDPMVWTKGCFNPLVIAKLRGERVLILEFMRLNPERARSVLEFAETRKTCFKSIVGPNRLTRVVIDIRQMLTHLGVQVIRAPDWVDPFNISSVLKKAQEKTLVHLEKKLSCFMQYQEYYADRITVAQKAFESASATPIPTRFDNSSLPRVALASSGVAMRKKDGKRGIHIIEKIGTAKDELEPPRKVLYREEEVPVDSAKPEFVERVVRFVEETPMEVQPDTPAIVQPTPPTNFTTEMKSVVEKTINSPGSTIITRIAGINISARDLKSLSDDNKLNDYVVESYLQLIADRSFHSTLPPVHSFTTVMFTKLAACGFDDVKTWTRNVNIFKCDLVFFPVHTPGHWTLVMVDMPKATVTFLDSLFNHNRAVYVTNIILDYLSKEYQSQTGTQLTRSFSTCFPTNIPQQHMSQDCGVFVCQFAEYLSRGEEFTFTQTDMPMIRELMVWELTTNTLLGEISPSRATVSNMC